MTIYRPGKFNITDDAMKIWNLPEKSKVLEIGCAEGDCTRYLTENYKFDMDAIDIDLEMINKAKKAHPDLNIKYSDGEFLNEYMSLTFDGIIMECVLSLINLPDEALHEAYCVLKKGGKLFISDLYMRNPEPEQLKAIEIEAKRLAKLPHQEGECEDEAADKMKFVDFRFEGRFLEKPLIKMLKEVGFVNIKFEDRTDDLQIFMAETIMAEGKDALKGLMTAAKNDKKTGYFMLTAEKPE